MKKFILALASFSMLFASCTKEIENPAKNTDSVVTDDIAFNITVANPNGDDATRAYIKSGWADGDKIQIWFDYNTSENSPNLVIKYNATTKKWERDKSATSPASVYSLDPNGGIAKSVYSGVVTVAAIDNYEYDGNSLTLSISNWTFLTKLQVVVTGITDSASDCTLACDRFTPYTGFTVGHESITATAGAKGAAVAGIANNDGIAFVFADSDHWDSKDVYLFTLSSQTDGTKIYNAYTTIARPNGNNSKIKGLKVSKDKFFVQPEYVDLGLSVKWATCNLGASTPDEYGDYFAWGETEPKDNYAWSTYFDSKDGTSFTKYFNGENGKKVLDPEDDAAHIKWGGNWRMPTNEEWEELRSNCTWTKKIVDNKFKGYTVTGKGAYENNSIFLPAAGYNQGGEKHLVGSNGEYFSSSLYSNSDSAYGFHFDSSNYGRSFGKRYSGNAVRPVFY